MIGALANGAKKLRKRLRTKKVSQKAHRAQRREAALRASEAARTPTEAAAAALRAYDTRSATHVEVEDARKGGKRHVVTTALAGNSIGALNGVGVPEGSSADRLPSKKLHAIRSSPSTGGHMHRAQIDHFGIGLGAAPVEEQWEANVAAGGTVGGQRAHHKMLLPQMGTAEQHARAAAEANRLAFPAHRPAVHRSEQRDVDHIAHGGAAAAAAVASNTAATTELRARVGAMRRAYAPRTTARRVSVAELRRLCSQFFVDESAAGVDAIAPLLPMCARSEEDGTIAFDNFADLLERHLVGSAPASYADGIGGNMVPTRVASQAEHAHRAAQAVYAQAADHLGDGVVPASLAASHGAFRASPPRTEGKKMIATPQQPREQHGILPWAAPEEESNGVGSASGGNAPWARPRPLAAPVAASARADHLSVNLLPVASAVEAPKLHKKAARAPSDATRDHLVGVGAMSAGNKPTRAGKAMRGAAYPAVATSVGGLLSAPGAAPGSPRGANAGATPLHTDDAPPAGRRVPRGTSQIDVVRGKKRVAGVGADATRTAAGFLLKASSGAGVGSGAATIAAGAATPRRGHTDHISQLFASPGHAAARTPTRATPSSAQRVAAGRSSATKAGITSGRGGQMSGLRTRSLLRWASAQSDTYGVVVKEPAAARAAVASPAPTAAAAATTARAAAGGTPRRAGIRAPSVSVLYVPLHFTRILLTI